MWKVENYCASRSVSLKAGAAAAGWLAASVGAAGLAGLKGFQGLDGHRRGEGLAAVVSSSEDSSLAKGVLVEGEGVPTFLSGVQPGGRRLLRVWEETMAQGQRLWLRLIFFDAAGCVVA